MTSNSEEEIVDTSFALGELAQLTVNNDVENSYDVSSLLFNFDKNLNKLS